MRMRCGSERMLHYFIHTINHEERRRHICLMPTHEVAECIELQIDGW